MRNKYRNRLDMNKTSANATRLKLRGRIRGGNWGNRPLKPTKVTLFTVILFNWEKSIRDIRPFCGQLFCHSSVVKYTSSLYSSEAIMRLDYQILLQSISPNLIDWIRPCLS